ncbi:hypothetical protein KKC16_02295 [Patescibacteria group bacterium]|nr:hypothetical protein [Patescibacteria group bacterium]
MKKSIIVILVLLIFSTTFSASFLFSNKQVKAQLQSTTWKPSSQQTYLDKTLYKDSPTGLGIQTATHGPFDDIGAAIRAIIDTIWQGIKESYQKAGDIAYKNSLRYFLNKVAYDTATHIATGSPGQKPLFVTNWKKYFKQTGDEALGDFFYHLGKDVWGKNLCEPLDPLVKINLEVSVKKAFAPDKVKCTWNDIKKNIGDLRNMKFNQLVQFSTHFNPSGNQLGAYLTLRSGAIEEKVRVEKEKNLVRVIEGSILPVKNPITGAIKTPASFVEETFKGAFGNSMEAEKIRTGNPVADAIGTFTNTLISKYLERIFKKGFNPQEGGVVISDFWTIGGVAGARLYFNELAEVNYSFGGTKSIDAIRSETQFADFVDDKFVQAINLECTVGQATGFYKQGDETYREECANLISGTARFGYDEDGTEVSGRTGLSVRSMLVLRKFRVIPVGWELSAEYYRNFEIAGNKSENVKRLNLNRLMQEYDDDTSPYYHLVDPDWLLKMPLTRCAKQGAGPQKVESEPYCLSQVPDGETCPKEDLVYPFQRLDYCADYETCLDDRSGQCDTNDWGYCVEEKPVWSVAGASCKNARQYSSCQTLVNAQDSSINHYLLNTVNSANFSSGQCDNLNAGCREYLEPITNNKIYLTSESSVCDARYQGCHLFYVDEYNTPDYYKLAPEYYNCRIDDTDEPDERCADFIKNCSVDDMDCEFYTPVSTKDPAVPAVITEKICPDTNLNCADETDPLITWNDECPASCVGYKNYHQMKTQFEVSPVPEPEFIADTADTCSQPGCDEFTNLDEVARGGEGIEYYSYLRQCIAPEQEGWDTYYTWQGSDTTGYQLKKWELVYSVIHQEGTSAPPMGKSCTDLTDADCREFFGQDLKAFKIYYSSTIVVSEDCHPFRRSIVNQSDCPLPFAEWKKDENGNGQCIYQAIPKESIKCSKQNNMCREYKSNAGYNYQKIIESYFTNADDSDNWTEFEEAEIEISTESVMRGDYSLKKVSGKGGIQHNLAVGDLEAGASYTLEFLAKGAGNLTAKFGKISEVSASLDLSDINHWMHYSLKLPDSRPSGLSAQETENNKLILEMGADVYLDNIILKKLDSVMLIKNSWETPAECERPANSMINCEAYQDRNNNQINLRNFSKLCSEDVVGCQLVTDGDNNQEDYYVLDKKFGCSKENRGCTALGLVTPDRDNEKEYSLENVYRKINPDNEAYEICALNETFCQGFEYQDKQENKYSVYFKDPKPMQKICEFKHLAGEQFFKWYKLGTDELCPEFNTTGSPPADSSVYFEKGYCLGGKSDEKDNSCDNNEKCTNLAYPEEHGLCANWVGQCNSLSSGCREFKDPQEPVGCDPALRNFEYTYDNSVKKLIKQDKVCNYYYYKDFDECQSSSVNPSQGCVGFFETSPGASDEYIRSFKVCAEDTGLPQCDDDKDCKTGKCVYTNNVIPNDL